MDFIVETNDMDLHSSNSSNWPAEFICPISLSVMADPVVVSSGQTYERRCIKAWMDLGQKFCVTQSIPLDRHLIISNSVLKTAINNMAKAKGICPLPSPPSVEQALALARRLIQKQNLVNAKMQGLSCVKEFQSDDTSSEHYQEKDVQIEEIHVEDTREAEVSEQPKPRESGQDDDLSGKMESSRIGDEVGNSSHSPDVHKYASSDVHGRKGIHLKSSSSLPPFTASTVDDIDRRRGNFVRGPARVRPPADTHGGIYARARTNLLQRTDQFRVANELEIERSNEPSFSPAIPSRDSQPVERGAGGPLRESKQPSRELPPHLVTRPLSYSSSEPVSTSSLPPSVIDHLVVGLGSAEEEKQEAAATELRQLTRAQENRIPLCRTDVIQALIPLFRSIEPTLQVNAVASLVNLSIEQQNKVRIVRTGIVRFLAEVLQNGCPEAQEHAAGAAFSLALADENKHPMGALNVIPPLVQLLHTGSSGARQDAAMALYHLSLLLTNKTKLVKGGAVPILLNLAQSKENPALASRALIILSNVASIPEGRAALLQLNAIPVLSRLLAMEDNSKGAASIAEHSAAVLVLLADKNARFKSLAQSAGMEGLLMRLVERGSIRARAKAQILLTIMKESSPMLGEPDGASVISRQYLRMRVDGDQMNSSAF